MKSSAKRKMPMSAQGIIATGFGLIILGITVLLVLPISSNSGKATDLLTALFTATSAVCVTGLVVVDTATHWSLFGRFVILVGIQIGGLGVMTILALISMMLGRRIGLRQRTLLQESVASLHIGGIVRLIRRAVLGTLLIEGLGAALLCIRFVPMLGFWRGLGYSVFHSISAFCNAGFDLMGTVSGPYTSLESFVSDPIINITIMSLITLGGLGFFVWDDLMQNHFKWHKLQLHSRVVLILSTVLIFVPAALLFVFERNASMAGLDTETRVWASLFSSVTPRTAGFDTVPTNELSPGGSLLTILLMLTGGNPGSTAGGVKTTTMLLVMMVASAILCKEDEVHVMGRRMENELIHRACSIVVVYVALSLASTLIICGLQPEFTMREVLLEVFSAIDTVGMSTGITRQLSTLSRIVIIMLMYAGRLGSLTFAILVARHAPHAPIQHPVDKLIVG